MAPKPAVERYKKYRQNIKKDIEKRMTYEKETIAKNES